MDDFLNWLDSPEGQNAEEAIFLVGEVLENCTVDAKERKIVWEDGKRLSIPQTAERIHSKSQSDLPLSTIQTHVEGWIEMHYEPQDLNEKEMEEFEDLIEDWIQDEHKSGNGVFELL